MAFKSAFHLTGLEMVDFGGCYLMIFCGGSAPEQLPLQLLGESLQNGREEGR